MPKRKRVNGGGGVAKKAKPYTKKRLRKYMYRLPEKKFIDYTLNDTGRGSSGAGQLINTGTNNNFLLIPEGDGASTRDGRRISVVSLYGRYFCHLNQGTSAVVPKAFRVMIVQDTQCNGADPGITTANTGLVNGSFNQAVDALAFLNLFNGTRFKVLYDKVHILYQLGAGTAATDTFQVNVAQGKLYLQFNPPIVVDYDASATTGVTTSIRRNNIFGVTMIDSASGATFRSMWRLRYIDA